MVVMNLVFKLGAKTQLTLSLGLEGHAELCQLALLVLDGAQEVLSVCDGPALLTELAMVVWLRLMLWYSTAR